MNDKVSTTMEDPLCIKRRNLRRVSLSDTILEDSSTGTNGSDNDSQRRKHKLGILQKKNSCSELLFLRPPANKDGEAHFNTIFKPDEVTKHDCFVKAFGHKGKNVGEFQDAKDITCLPRNRLLITDYINSRLQICSDVTNNVTIFSPNEIRQPWATAVAKDNYIAVTLCHDKCVKVLNSDGDEILSFGEDRLAGPTGIATDADGNFVVCDTVLKKVLMFDCDGNFLRYLGKESDEEEYFRKPVYVCVSSTGEIIVSDPGCHQVKVFDRKGDFVRSFGSFGRGESQFKCPYGVCTNRCGDIFVADHYNSRISMYTQDGSFIRHLVTSEHGLVHPQGLALSPDLHLYVTHGHLKASEILVFRLTNELDFEKADIISYV